MDILLMVEGVASSFGSSATSSLSLEHDEIETSSVVSDVVSISIFGSGIELGNAQNGTVDLGRFSLDNMESVTLYNGQK